MMVTHPCGKPVHQTAYQAGITVHCELAAAGLGRRLLMVEFRLISVLFFLSPIDGVGAGPHGGPSEVATVEVGRGLVRGRAPWVLSGMAGYRLCCGVRVKGAVRCGARWEPVLRRPFEIGGIRRVCCRQEGENWSAGAGAGTGDGDRRFCFATGKQPNEMH